MPALPVEAVLPELVAALRAAPNAVLIAPPGAGKTTLVAPALLEEGWATGTIVLLSPRRVAARAAAERMAALLGEQVGGTIGYLTRLDSRRSPRTRVLIVTEAIFVSTIVDDPELSGISAVLFDEAHERHLDSDLGLALAIECQQVLRPDLRLLVMSATIDGARFARLLGDAPIIESEGRSFPLDIRWLGAPVSQRIEDGMAAAIALAWREEQGDILAFLPGVREIARTAERLAERLPTALVLPLHGQCEPAEQTAAIRRDPSGRRRIVLATAIAESSLTLDGVRIVIDSGLARRAQFDVAAGVSHLVTGPASQAAAAQRAGRAARQGAGVAYRLWEKAAHAGRPQFDTPEIASADLAPLALTLARWGTADAARLSWLDPPPEAGLSAARERLQAIGALTPDARLLKHGLNIAALPLDPPLAAMVLAGARFAAARRAAEIAMLLQERGLGGRSEDLAHRLARWRGERGPRAEGTRRLAASWASRAERLVASNGAGAVPDAILLAHAFPDHLARRRDPAGEHWLTAGGRGYRLDAASPLAASEWLVIGDAQGEAKGARITAALPTSVEEITEWLPERIETGAATRWVADAEAVEAVRERRIGAIVLSRTSDPDADPESVADLLLEHFSSRGLAALPLSAACHALLTRAAYAGIAALDEGALQAESEAWLKPLIGKARSLRSLPPAAIHRALLARLDYPAQQQLERLAPAHFTSPIGSQHAIDYAALAGPTVSLRVQALFGLDSHPSFGQPPQPLLIELTSPAGRPLQTTRDLPAFWRSSWRDVQREMKGRYPRHRWPDRPWEEQPSLKTRNAFERGSNKA